MKHWTPNMSTAVLLSTLLFGATAGRIRVVGGALALTRPTRTVYSPRLAGSAVVVTRTATTAMGSFSAASAASSSSSSSSEMATSSASVSQNNPLLSLQQQQQQDQAKKHVQNALYRIREVNHIPSAVSESLIPFHVDGIPLGKVTPAMAQRLVNCKTTTNSSNKPVFELVEIPPTTRSSVTTTRNKSSCCLTLSESCGTTREERSQAVATVMDQLREDGVIHGWRNELYPVASTFYDSPVFVMERAAVHFLGALEYGVHINGLVKTTTTVPQQHTSAMSGNDDESTKETTRMWMARRSATKSIYPNMLDHIVAGGQPAGLSLLENVIKECEEEAGIPPSLTRAGIRPAGAISYETYGARSDSITRCVLFTFDLELPVDFVPTAVDGEVQEFFPWSVEEILASLDPNCPDPIKPNCYVVIIDWLVRQGHLTPDVPGYLDVLKELRSGDCQ